MPSTIKLISRSPDRTQEIGLRLGEAALPGDVYLLVGPLGAGKTCLTQGIAWGLGVEGYARSPTFVMITRYIGRLVLHHVDLFRIEDPLEALDIGLEEYLYGDDLCVVEWADRAAEVFPQDSLWIEMEYGPDEGARVLTLRAGKREHESLLNGLDRIARAQA